jgi:cell wall-associated NlpC family hydrolase
MGLRSLLASLAAVLVMAVPATAHTLGGWDVGQQRQVVAAQVMQDLPDGRFHGELPLSGGALNAMLRQLAARYTLPAVQTAQPFVSVSEFDRLVVDQLGLETAAATAQQGATAAGLAPPRYFGTEVVARLLNLRYDHPSADETLERSPWERISRAEAAYSLAVILRFGGWEVQQVATELATFDLPAYTPAQLSVLRTAVSKIGMPYVWGGETDGPSYGQLHGGYDCSGLVYRAYATRGVPRLTAAMYAAGIPKPERLHADELAPADVMFFGTAKFWSRATEASITHTALVLSPDWVIQSSSQGVALIPMAERLGNFAWGRRIL